MWYSQSHRRELDNGKLGVHLRCRRPRRRHLFRPQQAVASLIKRLAHRNANVQIYTLELANALSQNCGPELHRELASKAFTDALLRLASERTTHAQVKQKVLERMGAWTEEFARKPDLGIMEQAYQKLRQQQPGLMPPSKPVKTQISAEDRKKEEDELQMALQLSLKAEPAAPGQTNGSASASSPQQPAQQQVSSPQTQQGTTAATVSRVRRCMISLHPSRESWRLGRMILSLCWSLCIKIGGRGV